MTTLLTGNAVAIASQYLDFDAAHPERYHVNQFHYVRMSALQDGVLDGFWLGQGYTLIGTARIELTPLPREAITASQVEALHLQRQTVLAQFNQAIEDIDTKLGKLLALPCHA